MEQIRTAVQPFALQPSVGSTWARAALGVAAPAIERLLGLSTLGRMYEDATGPTLVEDFPERALDYLGIRWQARGAAIDSIPADGPLIVVANHPFGAADGLVLLSMIRQVRRDVRLLGNYLLKRIPELQPLIIAVDPFGGPDARAINRGMLRRAVDWTRRGGAVIVFPAGEVSCVPAADEALVDSPWKRGIARLVAQAGADVLPVYFDGRNSRGFEIAGRLHPRLRTALLPRELLRLRWRAVTAAIGRPIPASRVSAAGDHDAMAGYLRTRTYALAGVISASRGRPAAVGCQPIVAAVSPEDLARDVSTLPASRLLASHDAFDVYHASAAEVPDVLREIGRLREITFRAAGEGTGRDIDLDRYDRHYQHLFLWHRERREIAGAYRIGVTDELMRTGDLYTHSLFRYGRRFLRRLGPALELGRSFVRPEYQREYATLMLLWRGICRFAAERPRYRRLFGAVSISATYGAASRDLLVDALEASAATTPYAGLVRPRRPYQRRTGLRRAVSPGLTEIGRLLTELEPDGKGVPVLLRQYLKLNADVVACSVDADFSNVVDALLVVDLDRVDRATLDRYAGRVFRPGETQAGSCRRPGLQTRRNAGGVVP
jgi:putative hemolysin